MTNDDATDGEDLLRRAVEQLERLQLEVVRSLEASAFEDPASIASHMRLVKEWMEQNRLVIDEYRRLYVDPPSSDTERRPKAAKPEL